MVIPMLNPMMPMMNPYQMPFQQQTPINNQQSKTSYKKKKKFSPLSMFRIGGYVVFFSLFFKKLAKTFTIHRFDKFK
jgi:mRNA-degrading endonuclease RelE of RelBE toxin-antitoxin system